MGACVVVTCERESNIRLNRYLFPVSCTPDDHANPSDCMGISSAPNPEPIIEGAAF
jgi:hypothetical protein